MKNLKELTEQEILALTDEEITLRIKLKKAEEGIKLVPKPKMPSYFDIEEPDKTVYMCELFSDDLCFENMDELTKLIQLISGSDTKCSVTYDYNKAGSEYSYITSKMKTRGYSYKEWSSTNSKRVYSIEKYNALVDMIAQNKKMKEQYEKELKDYEAAISEAKWIEDEINDRVREVRDKYWKLNEYCRKFKLDYLPLADDNEEVAMKFMDKAYSLTDEQKEYVLTNYVDLKS